MCKAEPPTIPYFRHLTAANPDRHPDGGLDGRLRAFVAGDSDGDDLLHALYSHVLDEPVPARLRALLKR